MTIQIAKKNGELELNLADLVAKCALVQGVRGSGKSYLVRVIVEQTIPEVQTIILDPEGEFVSLREKLAILIAGPNGDVPCEVRSAKLFARRVAELGLSAVLDMSELSIDEQKQYVETFLTAIHNLPKSLWRPRLIVLDEAHVYCPESGKGKSVAREAVTRLMSQGRKRGCGAILVTQRLSKLNKDAAGEAANLFICETSPIDVVSAQKLLGITAQQGAELTTLERGTCFAAGKGLNRRGVTRVHVRKAQTTHPEPGTRYKMTPLPPPAVVKKALAELKDLPPSKEQEEAATLAAAQKKIMDLQAELRRSVRPPGIVKATHGVSEEQVERMVQAAVEKERVAHRKAIKEIGKKFQGFCDAVDKLSTTITTQSKAVESAASRVADSLREPTTAVAEPIRIHVPSAPVRFPQEPKSTRSHSNGSSDGGIRRIAIALATESPLSRTDLAILSRLVPSSGTFATYLGRLRQQGLLVGQGGQFAITPEGLSWLGPFEPCPSSGPDLVSAWADEIGGGGLGRIFAALADAGEGGLDRTALASAADLEASSGTFATYLGRLRRKGILNGKSWPLSLAPVFFRD